MTLYPEVLQEAQRSVDRVCEGRLPDFSDYDALPWVHAIVKECLRWRPVVPMSPSPFSIQAVCVLTAVQTDLAHMLTTDDIYEGYHIPKGSLVLANNWYASCAFARFHRAHTQRTGRSYTIQRHTPIQKPSTRDVSSDRAQAQTQRTRRTSSLTRLSATRWWQSSASDGASAQGGTWRTSPSGSRSRPSSLHST